MVRVGSEQHLISDHPQQHMGRTPSDASFPALTGSPSHRPYSPAGGMPRSLPLITLSMLMSSVTNHSDLNWSRGVWSPGLWSPGLGLWSNDFRCLVSWSPGDRPPGLWSPGPCLRSPCIWSPDLMENCLLEIGLLVPVPGLRSPSLLETGLQVSGLLVSVPGLWSPGLLESGLVCPLSWDSVSTLSCEADVCYAACCSPLIGGLNSSLGSRTQSGLSAGEAGTPRSRSGLPPHPPSPVASPGRQGRPQLPPHSGPHQQLPADMQVCHSSVCSC